MSAITEIPAKTPNPIGNTWRVFPGMVKPVVLACAAAAEADDWSAAGLAPVACTDDCPTTETLPGETTPFVLPPVAAGMDELPV